MVGLSEEIEPLRMPRALQQENPIVVFYTSGKPAHTTSLNINPQPEQLYLMSWFVRTGTAVDPEYILRLQNVVEGSDDLHVDLNHLFPNITIASWDEFDLALDAAQPRRQWGGQVAPLPRAKDQAPFITLSPLDMRTFLVRVNN